MPASEAKTVYTFTLSPHPVTRTLSAHRIVGNISRTPDRLVVTYVLEGDLEHLRVPTRTTPRFADELWRHTCFEVFIARKDEQQYYEFNFSPSGEWAAYVFTRYRERAPIDVELESVDPHVTVCPSCRKLELDAIVRLDCLSPAYANARLVLALSAVIEDQEGSLSYWALRHPLEKPDFHHPDAFVLELDEIRN